MGMVLPEPVVSETMVWRALARRVKGNRRCSPVLVRLALDGDPLSGNPPRHEVAAVKSGQCHAFGPGPDPVDLELGLLTRDPHEQLLETVLLVGLVAALAADHG